MKKITLILAGILTSVGVNAQLFSDGFEASEGYAVGDYIGPGPNASYWTTWSGVEGGSLDAQVTNAQAATGSNSIYFSSVTSGGGPQDVILKFGQAYNSGLFTYESAFYVDGGAYFNFQATQTPGQTWALNCNMSNGLISIDDGITSNLATGTYSAQTWFTLRIEANLTLGIWEAFVDGNSIGSWVNGIGSIGALDIFPLEGHSFYVDDVMFDYQTVTLPNLDAYAAGLSMNGNIAGLVVNPTVTIVNSGQTTLTSFDVVLDYNGNQYTENVTGVSLASTDAMEVTITSPVTLAAGSMTATATVSNANGGGADDDAGNDVVSITVDPIVPAAGKVVVGEEATGTWCGWCPRGAVYMDQYNNDYGQYWAGIAVHNGDPMTVDEYDAGIGALISGYPSSLVDRVGDVDPSAMSNDFFTRLQTAPVAFITNDINWNSATRELQVTVNANFQASANSNYKLLCVLTEDEVTGTTSDYNQANYYSGGSNGVMGGYESLSNPVPAAQMVYNHVARALEPSFNGDATVFPATVNPGDNYSGTYTFTLPADWNEANMHVIGMIIDDNGQIDNAGVSSIVSAVGVAENKADVKFNLYPNPATTEAIVEIIMDNAAEVELRLLDMSGAVLAQRNYGSVDGTSTIQLNTNDLMAGVYFVELTVNGNRQTKRLVVQ